MGRRHSRPAFFLGLLFWGCAPPPTYRVHPQLADRMREIRSAGITPPDIKIYEVSGEWVYRLQYSAPQRYYFEKDLAAFAGVTETFRLDGAGGR